jgi:sulfopropanediol 3-dehydrogenase
MEYLKKAPKSAETDNARIRETVQEMLNDVEKRGEAAVRALAERFDGRTGDFILGNEKRKQLIDALPESLKADIRFSCEQVRNFAQAQKESLTEFEKETFPGVRLGQRIIPMDVAGCYVPGGRFAHACSAIMSVATAKVAGVPTVIASSPPRGESIDPAVAYAMDIAGADIILAMGGVQAIATMAFGLFTGKPANILVGPGNAYVAEAKAILAGSGRCAIDVFAGPTESAVIADRTADPMTVAIDLVSQAEHGHNSPVWLFTDCRELGEKVLAIVPKVAADLPDPEVATTAWNDYGEVVLCVDRDEIGRVNDTYAAEHVQVMAEDLDWWRNNLRCYGSLFLGAGSTVSHGDKCSGTNHILPTRKAGYYSGGLNVHKFLKIYTYQQIDPEANRVFSAAASRLSRIEGMEGHARACDWRLRKYFPDEQWDFEVYEQKVY